jgi:hypothetical protein
VLEIYGSTETGALAMRRTARETRWLPIDGVSLDPVEGATLGRGAHFASPVTLLDEVVVEANGSFTLLGRQADLIKIAGRRASLAGLNLLLQDMPGSRTACSTCPRPATDRAAVPDLLRRAARPAATRRWLRARLDPVFLPRDFIRLERMPRSETGKLRVHALDLAYSSWRARARPQRGRRSTPSRERAWHDGALPRSIVTTDTSRSMSSWKAKAERGSAWLIHLIAWIARAAGRTVCRALLVPIVAYFVVTDATARRASREFLAQRPARRRAGPTCSRTSTASPRRCSIASGWRTAISIASTSPSTATRWCWKRCESGKGCVLLGSHLGSFDLMTLKNKVLYDRPVTLLMHIDDRARVRRIAGIDDSKLSIIPLGRFDSYLRAYEVLGAAASSSRSPTAPRTPPRCRAASSAGPRRSRSARMRSRRAPARRC